MNAYFVALLIPEEIGAELAQLTGDLAGVHWLDSSQYHITLAYLGRLSDDPLSSLKSGLNSIKHGPLNLRLGLIRLHPLSGEPRAIVAEVDKDDALDSLRMKVNRMVSVIGLDLKRERYYPHVTLGRFSSGGPVMARPGILREYLESRSGHRSERFDLYQFSLFSSQPTGSGYVYETEIDYDLI